jgi:putative NADH-flavin reductase
VIITYNPGWTDPNIPIDNTNGYKSIINEVKKTKIPLLLIVGRAGSLFAAPEKRMMDSGVIPVLFMAIESLAGVLYCLQKEEKELD